MVRQNHFLTLPTCQGSQKLEQSCGRLAPQKLILMTIDCFCRWQKRDTSAPKWASSCKGVLLSMARVLIWWKSSKKSIQSWILDGGKEYTSPALVSSNTLDLQERSHFSSSVSWRFSFVLKVLFPGKAGHDDQESSRVLPSSFLEMCSGLVPSFSVQLL